MPGPLGTIGMIGGGIVGGVYGGPAGAVAGAGAGGALGGALEGGGQDGGGAGSAYMDPGTVQGYTAPGLPGLAYQYSRHQAPMVQEGAYGAPMLLNANAAIPYSTGYAAPQGPSQAYANNQALLAQASNRYAQQNPSNGGSPTNPGGYQLGGIGSRMQPQTQGGPRLGSSGQMSTMTNNRLNNMTFGSATAVPGATGQVMANPATGQYAQTQFPGYAGPQNPSFRSYQEQLSADLLARSRGQGPSLAQQMFDNAADRNMRQQLSMAAGARGNRMLAMRNAQINGSQYLADTAGAAAAARLQEQQQAQGLLGQVSGQARGMDINVAQGNQDAVLRQQALNQQGTLDSLRLQQNGMQAYRDAITRRATGVAPSASSTDKFLTGAANLADIYLKTRQNNGGGEVPGLDQGQMNNINDPNAYQLQSSNPAGGVGPGTGLDTTQYGFGLGGLTPPRY